MVGSDGLVLVKMLEHSKDRAGELCVWVWRENVTRWVRVSLIKVFTESMVQSLVRVNHDA